MVTETYKLKAGKMPPYIGEDKWRLKYKATKPRDWSGVDQYKTTTKKNKLDAKNANRSLKKTARQDAQREINEQINRL